MDISKIVEDAVKDAKEDHRLSEEICKRFLASPLAEVTRLVLCGTDPQKQALVNKVIEASFQKGVNVGLDIVVKRYTKIMLETIKEDASCQVPPNTKLS